MNCNEAQRLCQEHLDGELSPKEEWALRVHCGTCGECGALFRDLDLLDRMARERYGEGQRPGRDHAAGKLEAVLACTRERKLVRAGRYRNLRRIAALLLVFAVASFSLWCGKWWDFSDAGPFLAAAWGKAAPWGEAVSWGEAAPEAEAPSSAIAIVFKLNRRNCVFSGCTAAIPWEIRGHKGG
jgi:predicted anti-sigma-YlaC factor YlaD